MSCHDETAMQSTTVSSSLKSAASNTTQPKFMMMMYFHTEISDYFLLKAWKLFTDADIGWMVLCVFATFALSFIYESLKQIKRWCSHRVKSYDEQQVLKLTSQAATAAVTVDTKVVHSCCSTDPQSNGANRSNSDEPDELAEQAALPTRSPVILPRTVPSTDGMGSFRAVPTTGGEAPVESVQQRIIPLLRGVHFLEAAVYSLQMFVSYLLMLIAMTYSVWLVLAILLGSTFGYFVFEWRTLPGVVAAKHCVSSHTQSQLQPTSANRHSRSPPLARTGAVPVVGTSASNSNGDPIA